MCEELSLTGHHCSNRKHVIHGQSQPVAEAEGTAAIDGGSPPDSGGTAESRTRKTVPTMPHMSSVAFLAACNCGRKQANREDPFTLKAR